MIWNVSILDFVKKSIYKVLASYHKNQKMSNSIKMRNKTSEVWLWNVQNNFLVLELHSDNRFHLINEKNLKNLKNLWFIWWVNYGG